MLDKVLVIGTFALALATAGLAYFSIKLNNELYETKQALTTCRNNNVTLLSAIEEQNKQILANKADTSKVTEIEQERITETRQEQEKRVEYIKDPSCSKELDYVYELLQGSIR